MCMLRRSWEGSRGPRPSWKGSGPLDCSLRPRERAARQRTGPMIPRGLKKVVSDVLHRI